MASFRIDPAPATIHPHMTPEQAITAAGHESQSGPAITINGDTVARFGLFTGNVVNVGTDANHTLQGSTKTPNVPVWIVMTPNLELSRYGGPPGGSPEAQCPTQPGAEVVVIRDANTEQLANMAGGGFQPLN